MPADYQFVAYIDEAGDPGLRRVQPIDPNGASEWMTMGALVVLACHEAKVVDLIRNIRVETRQTQGPDLHFRKLSNRNKDCAASMLAERNVRGFAVVSHKPNMRQHRNSKAEAFSRSPRGWFYNWCIRLLLERVSDFVQRESVRLFGREEKVRLVFSKRGGTEYEWLKEYIDRLIIQSRYEKLILQKRDLKHGVLDTSLLEVVPNALSAGCQLADTVTSAFHCAADASGNRWYTNPANNLSPQCQQKAASISTTQSHFSPAISTRPD